MYNEDTTLFVRMAPSTALVIYVGVGKDYNPYLFLYDVIEKQIKKEGHRTNKNINTGINRLGKKIKKFWEKL